MKYCISQSNTNITALAAEPEEETTMAFIAIACPHTASVIADGSLMHQRRAAAPHRPIPAHGIAAQAMNR